MNFIPTMAINIVSENLFFPQYGRRCVSMSVCQPHQPTQCLSFLEEICLNDGNSISAGTFIFKKSKLVKRICNLHLEFGNLQPHCFCKCSHRKCSHAPMNDNMTCSLY